MSRLANSFYSPYKYLMVKKENSENLRYGWTTGACATAATKSALSALLGKGFLDPVTITLPGGQEPAFPLATEELMDHSASASVIKDAGDDPDVTHQARIISHVQRGKPGSGVTFHAGAGVGTVTREGLPIAVGEAAINPVPRQMMTEVVDSLCQQHGIPNDIEVTIAIENGEELAKYTMNGRLGILGGLSVLGTTGIVVPYSCAAWIASLHRGIDVARAAGISHVIAATGSTSEKAANEIYHLPDHALLDMGDFAGGVLKYLKKNPVEKLTIAGGFAKIIKLAKGHMDLHSGRSQVDFNWLADLASEIGAGTELVTEIRNANTAMEVLEKCTAHSVDLPSRIASLAKSQSENVSSNQVAIEILIFSRKGELVGEARDE